MHHLKTQFKARIKHLNLHWRDTARNRLRVQAEKKFLIIRHAQMKPHFYEIILKWLEMNFPDIRSLFELHLLPCSIRDWSPYVLYVPWLQDPVQQWSLAAYAQANLLAAECDKHQIPIINRVDRLTNAVKSEGARLIASTGIRTPRMVVIEDAEEFKQTLGGLDLPLFVRENWGHNSGLIWRAGKPSDVRNIPLERFSRPVAVEWIDVQSQHDGLYRKYRYIAAGNEGVTHHLVITKDWITRGDERVVTDATRAEELAYVNSLDPNHERLQCAKETLGLDFVAFDYGYDHNGQIVVWEANPYPYINFSGPDGRLMYRAAAIHRTLAAMTKLYLERAELPVPTEIDALLAMKTPESRWAVEKLVAI